ncbi:hypothetical protein [Ralstonia syzygii]|uniref:hypothetical protein n=1 Tax=Ralstonia syzygii TaxID=28097 RepID=UPI0035198311
MTLADVIKTAINPALAILPSAMDTKEARVMLLAIGLQESRFQYRRQVGGPARGFWQFEEGTKQTRGGVWGVYLHDASRYWLDRLSASRGVLFQPDAIYRALDTDDVLAAGLARLMLFTDPRRLPTVTDTDGAWALYLRTWRPGKPRRDSWNALHEQARIEVTT